MEEESKFVSGSACAQHISASLAEIQILEEGVTRRDPAIRRPDTARAVLLNLEKLQQLLLLLQKQDQEIQEDCYWVLLNVTREIVSYCRRLRQAGFTRETARYLAGVGLALETNIVASATRYVDWRVTVYRELAEVYEEIGAIKAATKVITHALKQLQLLKDFEEAELPVPESVRALLEKAFFDVRALELRYGLIAGTLTPELWKKRLDEVYGSSDKALKLTSAMVSLGLQRLGWSRIGLQQGAGVAWKPLILTYIIDIATPDIKTICQSLTEIEEKKLRDSSYLEASSKKQTIVEPIPDSEEQENEPNLQELLAQNRSADAKMIKEKALKSAISTVPLVTHLQLLKQSYDCKLWDLFFNLSEWAELRIKLRRLEVPYVVDVDLLVSSIQDPKIPKGYDRLDSDLNIAHLRSELSKIGVSLDPSKSKKPDKKEEAKKPDPKSKSKQPSKDMTRKPEDFLEEEKDVVGLVKHSFVYLIVKKGSGEENAISSVEIQFGNLDTSPEVAPGGKAIALPIDQYKGKDDIEEKPGRVPYLLTLKLPQTHGSRTHLLTDIIPVIARSPNSPAPNGYQKLETDLRQTPLDQERLPNNTYVYLAYQTERETNLSISDFHILTAIRTLEQNKSTSEDVPELDRILGISWDMSLLERVSETIRTEISGVEGEEYAQERQDLLLDIALKLWSEFVQPTLKAKAKCDARGLYSEVTEGEYANVQQRWSEVESNLRSALDALFRVLTLKTELDDPLTVLNIGCTFVQMLEAAGEIRQAVQTLRRLQGEIVKVRETRLTRGVEARKDLDLAICISTSAGQVSALRKSMRARLVTWKHEVERKLRDLERKKPLDETEGDEEQWEVVRKAGEREQVEKEETDHASEVIYTEEEKDLFALHTQILVNLYRCELELERRMNSERVATLKTFESQGIEVNPLNPGISASVYLKSKQGTGKSAKKVKTDVQSLQQTLQETGRLPPKKPRQSPTEQILVSENSKNPYAQALLFMQMARFKSNPQEQKALLKDSFRFIKEAESLEENMTKIAVENAAQIFAAEQWNHSTEDTHMDFYPFRLLADLRVVEPRLIPEKPVIVSRSLTSITVKMVAFNPKITNKFDVKRTKTLALYGKEARAGTDVSLTNVDLSGLGKKQELDAVVTVSGLTPHEEYHFATAAYDERGECINGIGETCSTVMTLLPLPISLLQCYLAQVAFGLKQYMVTLKAANAVIHQFTESREGSLIAGLRLKLGMVHNCSRQELHDLILTFRMYVEALQLSDQETLQLQLLRDPGYRPVTHLPIQERVLKYCNVLLLALELAVMTEDYGEVKDVVWRLNDTLCPLLKLQSVKPEVMHALLKVYTALTVIPVELTEPAIRKICALVTYQLMRSCLQMNLAPALVNILTTDVQFPRRKVTLDSIQSSEEQEPVALYETLARCDETQEIAKKTAEKWKEAFNTLPDIDSEAIAGFKLETDGLIEALTFMKSSPDGGLQKFNQAPNGHYLEWCVKGIRILMEKGGDLKVVGQCLGLINVPPLPVTMQFIQTRISQLQSESVIQNVGEDPSEENPNDLIWASEVFLLTATVDFLQSVSVQTNESRSFLDINGMEVGALVKEDGEIPPQTIEKPLELLMKSGVCARRAQAWSQLQNVLRVCSNILNFHLPSPAAIGKTESWGCLAVLAESSLDFLEAISGLDKKTVTKPKVEFEGTRRSSAIQSSRSETHEEAARPWFLSQDQVDIYLHSNIIAFAVQTLLCAKKWQALVRVCDRMNFLTQNYFAGPILPFKIYAEKTLFDAAKAATERKISELEGRNQEYETWKTTSKRRKTRQAMLTGEVPQEQLDYERDVQLISEEIAIRQNTENALRSKLKSSEDQLEMIKRGANTAYESLVQSRRLMEQYGTEARTLEKETQDGANRMKRKAQKVFANLVLGSYRKTVEILRKRRERSLLAQALHELGCLCLIEGNIEEAEASWSDSVDTVFQSLYCISSFRKLLGNELLAEKYGIEECLLAGVVLQKMSLHCYESSDVHRARECLLFAAVLLAAPLKLALPHPERAVEYKMYRLKELTPNCSLEDVNRTVPLTQVAVALEFTARGLLENACYPDILPLVSFLECLSCDYLMSPGLAFKARNLRIAALTHLGYIDEALETWQKITSLKDLPSAMVKRPLVKERENSFWQAKIHYQNSLPPEHPQNQEAIQYLIKTDIPTAIATVSGVYNYLETVFSKGILLTRLGQSESLEEVASEPLRKQLNSEGERVLRTVLKTLSFEEELTRTKEEWTVDSGKPLLTYLQGRAPDVLPTDTLIRDQVVSGLVSPSEENLSDPEKRILRLRLLVRTRESIAQTKQNEGELTSAVKIMKQCVLNLQKYAVGQLGVESGTEKDLYPLGAVVEEAKKDPVKKPVKDSKARAETPSINLRPTTAALAAVAAEKCAAWTYRDVPGPSVWLRIKYRLLSLLYTQARYQECKQLLTELSQESANLKDAFYLRQGLELKSYILLREGKLDESLVSFEEMMAFAAEKRLSDSGFAYALGNYGQLLAHRTHYQEAWNVLKQARELLWTYLRESGIVIVPEDVNKDAGEKGVLIMSSGREEGKAAEALKPGEKKKPVAQELKEEGKKQRVSAAQAIQTNTTLTPPNIYLNCKLQMVLLDLTYAHTWLQKDDTRAELPLIEAIVETIAAVASSTVHLPTATLAQVKLTQGKVGRLKVLTEVYAMQQHFVKLSETKKRYRKFARTIPDYSLASGRSFLGLPGFNEQLTEHWIPQLLKTREVLEQAMRLASKESVLLTLEEAFRELYQVLILLKELRPRVGFKYLENTSRPPDSEGDGKEYYEDLVETERLDQHRLLKDMARTLTVLKEISESKKYLTTQFSLLGTGSIQDMNKVPKIVLQEILEADFNCKKTYSPGLFDENKKKTTVNTYDCVAYLLKNTWDLQLLALGRETRSFGLLKLHRLLLSALPNYQAKNKFLWEPAGQSTSLAEVVAGLGSCLGFWETRDQVKNEKAYLQYLWTPMDADNIIRNEIGEDEVGVLEFSHKDEFFYGEVRSDPKELSQLLQGVLDLRDRFNASYQLSQEKYDRDMVYHRKDFRSALFKFASLFHDSLRQLKEGETNVMREKAEMAISELAPEVSEEILTAFASVLRTGGFLLVNPNLNALFRCFHGLRYTI